MYPGSSKNIFNLPILYVHIVNNQPPITYHSCIKNIHLNCYEFFSKQEVIADITCSLTWIYHLRKIYNDT